MYILRTRENNLRTRDKRDSLKNNGLSIVENHRKIVITKVFGVIRTASRK